jgi:HD-GYP domain-containing protein (c-di-GMP phosphodiesterase class II)
MILGKQLNLEPDKLRALGIGGLFHDAGEGKLPATIRKAPGKLTSEQQRQFEEHPILGIKIAAKDPGFPALGFTVIQEHHERLDGSGYPFGLKANKLSFLSQIVMVVDEYDELINPRDPARAMPPSEALSYLFAKRQNQLSKDVMTALIQTRGVYPPGSIVQLSDGPIGLVLSLGEPDRMRPMVVVYDDVASQEKPHIVDLASVPALAISRLVPKQDIPPDAAQYLNYKRWAGYFIRGGQEAGNPAPDALPEAA